MEVAVYPSTLHGDVCVPPSKSYTQRAFALALLHNGKTIIKGAGKSKDENIALQLIGTLGAEIKIVNDQIEITGIKDINYSGELFCGESGLLIRLFVMICCTGKHTITLTGSGSLLERDMSFFEKYLPTLGVAVLTTDKKIPITISGPMQIMNMEVDGSSGSQYISGLLMAFAKLAEKTVTLHVSNAVSKPYLDITVQMMKTFGYKIFKEQDTFTISPSRQISKTIHYKVEGDWSNGAFLLVAAAIAGESVIHGLDADSLQGDKKIMHILAYCGVNAEVTEEFIHMYTPHFLYAFSYDATDTPDLFPPLVALACNCNGQTVIKGVHRLINKESNRAASLVNVFTALGADISITDDVMIIEGKQLKGGTIDSCNDHRIAMAAAVAALKCEQPVIIKNAQAVDKSYPDFFVDIQSLGAKISITA